jgi:hypothetical protein
MIGSSQNASCCTETGRKLFTSCGITVTFADRMNTWNTLPESYQRSAYKFTPVTVKRQIQQAENLLPAVVISLEMAGVSNTIRVDDLTSKVPSKDLDDLKH